MKMLYARKGLLITTAIAFHCAVMCLTAFQGSNLIQKDKISAEREGPSRVVSALVRRLPPCAYVVFSDGRSREYKDLVKVLSSSTLSQGISVIGPREEGFPNTSQSLHHLKDARKVRRSFSCVTMVVVSDNFHFLANFAKQSLKDRLLSASTRIIVVSGRLQRRSVVRLTNHWVYSMNKAMIIIPRGNYTRWDTFTLAPFSASGRKLLRTASWSSSTGLVHREGYPLFPPKFLNFHGNPVNVTSLPYKPYWEEIKTPNGTVIYSGSDGFMLQAMASSMNFTIAMVPVNNWQEVLDRVAERVALMAPIYHVVLPQRLEQVDFSRTFEHGTGFAFAMAKPLIKPQWESLYYPLSNQVWLIILSILLMTPIFFKTVYNRRSSNHHHPHLQDREISIVSSVNMLDIFGMLLGQTLSKEASPVASARILLFTWIVFAFVVGTAYKGNLIASIVAPRIPPRAETIEQLARVCERLGMASYGAAYAEVMKNSNNEAYRTLGNIADIGIGPVDGLGIALTQKSAAYANSNRYLALNIAEHYTEVDGSTKLYVGREILLPSINAWPIPHDAPYKDNIDSIISAVIEHGLYNKWMNDMLNRAKKIAQERLLRQLKEAKESGKITEETLRKEERNNEESSSKALTIAHLQGPFMIMVVGACIGGLSLTMEVIIHKFFPPKRSRLQKHSMYGRDFSPVRRATTGWLYTKRNKSVPQFSRAKF